MKILVTRTLPGNALKRLQQHFDVDLWPEPDAIPAEILRERIKDKQGLLCLLNDPIGQDIMAAAPELKIIANYAVGYDNIDIAAARRNNITVTNTPGVLTDATADLAWSLLFAAARRTVEADGYARSGKWQGWDPNLMLGHDIFGQTLGIIGAGRIGTAMALRSRGFEMPVVYTSRSENRTLEDIGARRVDLTELLETADFISLHVALTAETRHLIGSQEFERMKDSCVIINTARGPIIDEKALVHALKTGQIAGAGLDVFEEEPRIDPGLSQLENVVMLPHIGSATVRTRSRMADMAVDNLIAFFDGKTPPNMVI